MTVKERRLTYGILKVRRSAPQEYYLTISKDGQSLGDVTVRSTSIANGYFNDDDDYDRLIVPTKRRASK